MPEEERMTIDERYKYLRRQHGRYDKADRAEKGRLLDGMEAVTGLHRKSLIRRLTSRPERKKRRRQRGPIYRAEVRQVVLTVAEATDWACAERLRFRLTWMAKHLEYHGEVSLNQEILAALERISVSTVRRILSTLPHPQLRLPRRPSTPNPIARKVTVAHIPWDVEEPGHVEIDLVHHAGGSSQGEYLHTLQVVDVASGWSERAVVPGRSYLAVSTALAYLLDHLPFPVLEVHCDNGSEFLNHHVLTLSQERWPGVRLTRSRPYHKNDNRLVEQRNFALVRAYLGYGRLASPQQARLLSRLYQLQRLYHNLFQPVMHLVEKTYDPDNGTTRRRYDQTTTPFDRLLTLNALDDVTRQAWEDKRLAINPLQMRETIYALRDQLLAMPTTTGPGDVRVLLDLLYPSHTTIPLEEAALPR